MCVCVCVGGGGGGGGGETDRQKQREISCLWQTSALCDFILLLRLLPSRGLLLQHSQLLKLLSAPLRIQGVISVYFL